MANEKRLIDANALEYHKFCDMSANDTFRLGWNSAIDAVMENAPTIDAVEVVRCKDCKYKHPDLLCCCNIRIYDEPISVRIELDDFCSYGERREGE